MDPDDPRPAESRDPSDTTVGPLTSPLHSVHRNLGATIAAFGGWQMPISYDGGGVVAEHTAVRERVGLFDVSHLGKASVTGPGAAAFVNRCLTADLGRIKPGQAQYTMCGNESGGVLDDLIAYLEGPDSVFLVPNAANTAAVVAAFRSVAPAGIEVTDRHRDFGVLAVQGPLAAEVVAEVGLPTDLPYMSWADGEVAGRAVRVCRTGYTGERGYELLPGWDDTPALWEALLTGVTARGGRAAGLGARDTLRTEMGYPLHGQDLSATISPLSARAGWAVGWAKDEFFGRTAMLAEREAGANHLLWGLLALDRGVIRPHQDVVAADGEVIGTTTSGTFSPTLGQGIGLALLDTISVQAPDLEVAVDIRGRRLRARVVKPPFVPSHVR